MTADALARQPLEIFDVDVNSADRRPSGATTQGSASELRPLLIAIPFYKGEQLVAPVTQSLLRCADEIRELRGEIVLFNDSPDYAPLGLALTEALQALSAAAPTRVETNPHNLGFVHTMNQAIAEAVERRYDVLLLNSDTMIFPGALREMARVQASDPMIAFVNPRSNNATLATLPSHERFQGLSPEAAHAAWADISSRLPDVAYVPTAVGFCLLCRWKVLAEFGGFDEVYGAGYHEENDLIMRANRCGYRAALANKAFVWHEGATSFSLLEETKAKRDRQNEAILFARYPEYPGLVSNHFESPEHHAEQLLSTLIPDEDGRLEIAFDLSAFGPYHNGTFAAGRQLLIAAAKRWSERFKLYAICSSEAYRFHDFAALGVERRDPQGRACYAAVFRIGQPYGLGEIDRLVMQAAVIGVYMLDTISIDCGELYSPRLYNLWQLTLDHADLIATTSQLSTDQLERRFQMGDAVRIRAMHSVDLEDYRPHEPDATGSGQVRERPFGQPYLLVVGNKFPHKYVTETANALAEAYPNYAIVALGVARPDGTTPSTRPTLEDAPNLFVVPVGDLSQAEITRLYADAHAVVFPTHYEGFGFPLLDALAVKTPIFARRNAALEEVWRLQGSDPNVHFFDLTTELVQRLQGEVMWTETPSTLLGGDAGQSADDILAGLERALDRASYRKIVDRIRAIQFVNDIANDEASKRSQTLAREARGLAKRLSAAQAEMAALKQHMEATEQTLGGRTLNWTRRRLSSLPWIWRPLHRTIYGLMRSLKPAAPAPAAVVDPTTALIAGSGLFDAEWYLAKYPDIALAGADPLAHFVSQALEERRDPGPGFSTVYYLEQRPDVFDTGMNPLEHYLTTGRADGAKARR